MSNFSKKKNEDSSFSHLTVTKNRKIISGFTKTNPIV